MYISAVLFFKTVFLQCHTPFVTNHKLPDPITEEGKFVTESMYASFLSLLHTAKPAHVMPYTRERKKKNESRMVWGPNCKVHVAEPPTWGFELSVVVVTAQWVARTMMQRNSFDSSLLQLWNEGFHLYVWHRSNFTHTVILSSCMGAVSTHDVLSARQWQALWSNFVAHTCSSGFKSFYPFINVPLTDTALP